MSEIYGGGEQEDEKEEEGEKEAKEEEGEKAGALRKLLEGKPQMIVRSVSTLQACKLTPVKAGNLPLSYSK